MLSLWKRLFHIGLIIAFVMTFIVSHQTVRAESCDGQYDEGSEAYYDCLSRSISDLTAQLEATRKASAPLESEVARLSKQVTVIQNQLKASEVKIKELESSIDERDREIRSQYALLTVKVRDLYKKMSMFSPFLVFASSSTAGELTRGLAYKAAVADKDKNLIILITTDILSLESDKKKIETDRTKLAMLQNKLDIQKAFFEKEIAGAKKWQSELSGKIASLSAKQQEILQKKLGSIKVPLLAASSLGGCVSDIDTNPGFGGARFAFFSLGVPNRVGLNQYGAKGRAEAGQSHEDILKAYYDFSSLEKVDTSISIKVNGKNPYNQVFDNESMNLEEYLKHLYEMPPSWDSRALKAQAIAARSYVLARTNNGQNSIPPSEEGQVVKKEENTDSWKSAVRETEGMVMKKDGNIVNAWYSSTHGGFVLTASERGWSNSPWTKHNIDATSASSLSDLRNTAYDRQSPWFYCDWGYRKEYNSTAWLKENEVVDVVNAFMLWQRDHNSIVHLSQVDGGVPDTWNADKVRQELGGEAISSISNIAVDWNGSGISQTISVNGRSFPAQQFKNMFNVRAPGNIQLKPSCNVDSSLSCGAYALFNVERK